MERSWYVYLMASRKRGASYVGITNNPARRVWEHKTGIGSKHAKKYQIERLVWLQEFPSPSEAIAYEKDLKKWRREWKFALVEKDNPDWNDLYEAIQS